MTKAQLIEKISEFDANLIWEIDNPDYYGLIGWNGGRDDSYWIPHQLEVIKNKRLIRLLNKLKEIS